MSHYSMRRRALIASALAAAAATFVPGRAAARGRWWSGLVLGLFENHGFASVSNLPSHRRLATEGAVLTRYFAVSHPSGPNYRALISGETWGRAETIEAFHRSVGSEATALVPPIATYVYHLAGAIARRHNPFSDLGAPVRAVRSGLQALRSDLAGGLPSSAIAYVGWDDANDMHDGDVERADRNLTALLDLLSAAPWFTTPDSEGRYPALFFCYDEDDYRERNRVFAAWWGRGVKSGFASAVPHSHYSFCRTVTDNWGLPVLGHAGGEAPISEVWR